MYNLSNALLIVDSQDVLGIRRAGWEKSKLTITKGGRGLGRISREDMKAQDWIIVPKKETVEDMADAYVSIATTDTTLKDAWLAGYKARHARKEKEQEETPNAEV